MPLAIRFHRGSAAQCSLTDNDCLSIKLLQASFLLCWLVILLLVFTGGPVYADWGKILRPYPVQELQTLYVDPATIRKDGALGAVWQLTDYRWMQGEPRATPRFLSTTIHKQFDCLDKRLRLLAYTECSRRMATGEASNGSVDKDLWLPVGPDSINHALWEMVCRRP